MKFFSPSTSRSARARSVSVSMYFWAMSSDSARFASASARMFSTKGPPYDWTSLQ